MQDWNDPQLSDGDMPQPKSDRLYELNDYLRMLADMDTVSIHHKFFLLQSYIDMMRNRINEL